MQNEFWSYHRGICFIFGRFFGTLDVKWYYLIQPPCNLPYFYEIFRKFGGNFSHRRTAEYTNTNVMPAAADPIFSISDTDISIWFTLYVKFSWVFLLERTSILRIMLIYYIVTSIHLLNGNDVMLTTLTTWGFDWILKRS